MKQKTVLFDLDGTLLPMDQDAFTKGYFTLLVQKLAPHGYDPAALVAEIKKLRERCDYLVVYVHWGIERDERPQEYQRALGQQYIDAGADLVIGSHPHVLQGLEYCKGKPIVYSLGNFVFGSSIPRTAVLQADWDGETTKLCLVPATSAAGYTRMVTDEAKKQEFYDYMTGISYGVSVTGEGVGQ